MNKGISSRQIIVEGKDWDKYYPQVIEYFKERVSFYENSEKMSLPVAQKWAFLDVSREYSYLKVCLIEGDIFRRKIIFRN